MTARCCLKRALSLTVLVMLAPRPSQAAKGSACSMAQATIARDEAGIRETMAAYNAALNGGKTAAVLPLYSEDGVFMPPYSQSAVGKSAVAAACDKVFAVLFCPTDFPEAGRVVERLITASGFTPVPVGSFDKSIRIEVGGDLHEFGKLGKLVSAKEAQALI